MKEIKSKRKTNEKHFLNIDGTITAFMYDEEIHYLKNGKYEEIDNTLKEENGCFVNKENAFHTYFKHLKNTSELLKVEKDNHYISLYVMNQKNDVKIKTDRKEINYLNILNNIDFNYQLHGNKVKESIILNNKEAIDYIPKFIIKTDLELIKENNKIIALYDKEQIFTFDLPYMLDQDNNLKEITYELIKKHANYELLLNLDYDWLLDKNRTYPVIIDPTITSNTMNTNVYDTYIYEGDTNVNRNIEDILKIGVDKNKIYRSLIKFDLPTIGTGSDVIYASANIASHKSQYNPYDGTFDTLIDIHQVTESWSETTANWNNMHDKYKSRIEDYKMFTRSDLEGTTINLMPTVFDITNLVKKWYASEPNYGILLKAHKEEYKNNIVPAYCYSKNHSLSNVDPKPFLTIVYRNQNGLEDYMSYQTTSLTNANSYINYYTGNLTTSFNVASTIAGRFPVNLKLYYNTNDVVLNNDYGYGLGYKLSLHQLIKERVINNENMLEYIDADGTIHYFYHETETNYDSNGNILGTITKDNFIDEDGLSLRITKRDNDYIMKDKDGNTSTFTKNNDTWYLTEIRDTKGSVITITYENNKIRKIIDDNQEEITLYYAISENELHSIFITGTDENITLTYQNNQLVSLETRQGFTLIEYNQSKISKIIDPSGISINYEYYSNLPYRVKKVSEYGLNNELGNTLTFNYSYLVTNVVDNKGKASTYTFNTRGNAVNITNLNGSDKLIDAYAKDNYYGYDSSTNKITLDRPNIRYVNNLLTNTSFEKEGIIFTSNGSLEITNEASKIGSHSLKASSLNKQAITKEVTILKGKYYTFSAYIKNNSNTLLSLSYLKNNEKIENISEVITPSDDFYRYDVTILYPSDATSNLTLKIEAEPGTIYIDDVQLEEGNLANYYNLVDNSNFNNGITNWDIETTINDFYGNYGVAANNYDLITLSDGNRALKINSDSSNDIVLTKEFNINGKKNDHYNLSFFYKNEGIGSIDNPNMAVINFNYLDQEMGSCVITIPLNLNETEWQFFSHSFVAEKDFDQITLVVFSLNNVNSLYLTNFMLYKDLEENNYEYDLEGNLISSKSSNGGTDSFNYDKNNQLINMLNPKGSHFSFEYDNNVKNRVLRGISKTGIVNQIKYDSSGNPIKTKIYNINTNDNLESNYYIRLKGTEYYLKADYILKTLSFKEDDCSHDIFKLIKQDNKYKIKPVINPDYLINSNLTLTKIDNENCLFELIKNKNESYSIKYNDKYLTCIDGIISLSDKNDSYNQQFYLEDSNETLFIQNEAIYDMNEKFINKTIDTLGNTTTYDVDTLNGQINKVTNSKGIEVEYTYNDKKQLTNIKTLNKEVEYVYNDSNVLTDIIYGNIDYNFTYDNFLNTKTIKINNNPLIDHEYESNNGNLLKSTYGNNDIISFTYDEFDRMKTLNKMNDTYKYYYNNLGSLSKVITNNDIYKYYYDLNNRLSRYEYNNFKIDYDYDINNNVTNKLYKYNNLFKNIAYTYNEDDEITNINNDNIIINNTYDSLGRLKQTNIDNKINKDYNYITKGNRTSLVVDKITTNNDTLKYKYDELYNITDIYLNDELINHYDYDIDNELIKDDDYERNITTRYEYDNYGNILSKKEYELNTFNLYNEKIYEYSNTNWRDQLTKYDDTLITYDNIGNPLTIGNKTLSWINGRELNKIEDDELTVTYKYNKDGIRTSKIVNGIETKYYVENNAIIIEKRSNDVLYYVRDDNNELIGFKYNDEIYYYIKNIGNDIIGIIDSAGNRVVTYKYDSYGNILSIEDTTDNNIGTINPYRYRSYYYDTETKLYYLNSRYYNPLWGRFINADGSIGANEDILSQNLYAYASNNYVNYHDVNGREILGVLILIAGAGIYVAAKNLIARASNVFLRTKGNDLSSDMFNKAMYNSKTPLSNRTKKKIENKTKKSPEIKNLVKSCIKRSNGRSFKNCGYVPKDPNDSFEFKTEDLHYSIQHATVKLNGSNMGDHWEIGVHLDDTYDFTEPLPLTSFSNAANDLGLGMQKLRMLKPYYWEVDYTFNYYEE